MQKTSIKTVNVTMKNNQYVLNFMGSPKYLMVKKTFTIVPEDEEIKFRALTKKTTMRLHLQNVDFFNSGYKYSMDILQDVRGRKIQYIKLILLI
jgi:hypothetical protein